MATLLATDAIPLIQLSIAFGSVGAGYTFVGSFTQTVEILTVVSTFNQPVQMSLDAVNPYFAIPIGNTTASVVQWNFKGNLIVLPVNWCNFYVQQITAAPTSGNLYINGFSAAIP